MKVDGQWCRAIFAEGGDPAVVKIIDQRWLPHKFVWVPLDGVGDVISAIKDMKVRGAPLIGVTGAWGVYVAVVNKPGLQDAEEYLRQECGHIREARPTAVNLAWAVDRVLEKVLAEPDQGKWAEAAKAEAERIADWEVENCRKIGEYGADIIEKIHREKGGVVNILTHCNAGWLACVDYGTATAPMYAAHDRGIPIHVWVDETRPLNQGSRLTAWELLQHGVPHTVIVDNAGGHLMQHGQVDMVLVGSDRTTYAGDVANKIGTYLKALAAKDNNIPFYAALPSSTIDWETKDGVSGIPIEERDPDEVRFVPGLDPRGDITPVLIPPKDSPAGNPAFDVTPARLVTGIITERGVVAPEEKAILELFERG
ncbi:MAG: S-methyl-5-thioribose-1-phosphate isomerase [Deltaproteobacteria bacterium]|nr:S-methyl-5-thioribose-1-phosphate isomerase [Deltaproteobacteria bacterium]